MNLQTDSPPTASFSLQQRCIGWLGAMVLRSLRSTQRWEHVAGPTPVWPGGRPVITVFWHSQQLMMPWLVLDFLNRGFPFKIHALISRHGDGRLIAAAMEYLGIGSVAGSSTRGAIEASRELLSKLKAGEHIGITPDGPRGPAEQAKPGAIRLAAASGAPIVPVALCADRVWQFNSWDRMFLPKPFARVSFVWGTPFEVPANLDNQPVEFWTTRLTTALNQTTALAAAAVQARTTRICAGGNA